MENLRTVSSHQQGFINREKTEQSMMNLVMGEIVDLVNMLLLLPFWPLQTLFYWAMVSFLTLFPRFQEHEISNFAESLII